jgi:hypothetical protein
LIQIKKINSKQSDENQIKSCSGSDLVQNKFFENTKYKSNRVNDIKNTIAFETQ